MATVYWLGAPGVSQLEYPPGSGVFYNVGDLIPGMSEPEAQVMVPLGHSFEIPNVYPYGTPYMEPAAMTQRRVPHTATRTGEPEGSTPGVILNGPAPQANWVAPEPPPAPGPELAPGVVVHGAAPQESWTTSTSGSAVTANIVDPPPPLVAGEGVVAVAVPAAAELAVTSEPEDVVAVAVPDPEPPPEPPEPLDQEPAADESDLEPLPDFGEPAPAETEEPAADPEATEIPPSS
ncbi:MAG TPA: hypothetical protein VGJ60_07670 [Chloroflexota bacterium]|jgi:hypothetical protein